LNFFGLSNEGIQIMKENFILGLNCLCFVMQQKKTDFHVYEKWHKEKKLKCMHFSNEFKGLSDILFPPNYDKIPNGNQLKSLNN